MPKHDVLVITQSGIYQQDKIDQDFGVNNEALDIAATQVFIIQYWSNVHAVTKIIIAYSKCNQFEWKFNM